MHVRHFVCSLAFKSTVIIFLSALSDEGTEVRGLETGADDYLTKPISPKILVSKVNALFRRINKEDSTLLQINDLTIDREKICYHLQRHRNNPCP